MDPLSLSDVPIDGESSPAENADLRPDVRPTLPLPLPLPLLRLLEGERTALTAVEELELDALLTTGSDDDDDDDGIC